MTHVLTLIAPRGTHALQEDAIARTSAALPQVSTPDWLSPGEACDIPFSPASGQSNGELAVAVRAALGDAPIDIVCQPVHNRRKQLLVADMDSTLIGQECIDEIAAFMGFKPKIAQITERAMRGEIEFEPALRERVALLKGLEETALQTIFDEQVKLSPGARTLARTMAAHGARTVIVSGGFTYFTGRVAQAAGFDAHYANELEFSDGRLSGRVIEPILGQQAKLDMLREQREALGLATGDTLGVGDGANDLAMLGEAGLGVAYHAKPIVAAEADARIDHGDLTALLFAQGYKRREFAD